MKMRDINEDVKCVDCKGYADGVSCSFDKGLLMDDVNISSPCDLFQPRKSPLIKLFKAKLKEIEEELATDIGSTERTLLWIEQNNIIPQ